MIPLRLDKAGAGEMSLELLVAVDDYKTSKVNRSKFDHGIPPTDPRRISLFSITHERKRRRLSRVSACPGLGSYRW